MIQEETTQLKLKESGDASCHDISHRYGLHFSNLQAKDLSSIDNRLTTFLFFAILPITIVLIWAGLVVQKYFVFWWLLFFWAIYRFSLQNLSVPQYFVDFSTSLLFVLLKLTFFS